MQVDHHAPSLYPSASTDDLKKHFINQRLQDVHAPAAVIDAAVVRRNCKLMLEAAEKLDVGFRAHVKTHKTLEITKVQVGPAPNPVRLVCSTVSEIEHVLPWLLECKSENRHIDVLYGLPLSPSQIPRLGRIAKQLGPGILSIFIDHPDQIAALEREYVESRVVDYTEVWEGLIPVWVNIDVGYHREGVTATSTQLSSIARALGSSRKVYLAGLYAHDSTCYNASSPNEALEYMASELGGLLAGAEAFLGHASPRSHGTSAQKELLTLSIGATPTATSFQNLLDPSSSASSTAQKCTALINKVKENFQLEIHAGVYSVNDLQQLATRARPAHLPRQPTQTLLSHADLAFCVLAEVVSDYPDRTARPEALIAAGSLALGREPCKSYPGWGVLTPWPHPQADGGFYDPEGEMAGWIVGRISQEHGILTWEGEGEVAKRLTVGEKVMVWPNHACIAAAHFGWFVVVDSEMGDADVVRDVWVRWRGW